MSLVWPRQKAWQFQLPIRSEEDEVPFLPQTYGSVMRFLGQYRVFPFPGLVKVFDDDKGLSNGFAIVKQYGLSYGWDCSRE